MLPLTRILVPVDFSERSVAAVHYARNLACHFHAELALLHVLHPVSYDVGGFGGVVAIEAFSDRRGAATRELSEFLADDLIGLKTHRLVLEGDPATSIVEYAHNEQISLIVMPTHGYGPFRRFLIGSVAAKVLHDADCPVLTGVHLEEGPALEAYAPRKILCAVDLGPHSDQVLAWASQMAKEFHASLALVHATPLAEQHFEETFDPEWRASLEQRIHEKLDELLGNTKTQADAVVIESGTPADVISAEAQRFDADLVVIGRSVAAGIFGRLRANAYSIIRQSPCPVASV
jgi:nucleotide-binding universal stress UspA family protein